MKNCIPLLLLSSLIVSCVSTHSKLNKSGAGIITWETDRSAAVIIPASENRGIQGCMQMALSMTDIHSQFEAGLSDSILKVIDQIPDPTNPSAEDLAKIKNEIEKTSKALNVSSERTSFLMVGSFYLCQLQANGMPHTEVKKLTATLINAAAGLKYSEYNIGTQKDLDTKENN